MSSDAMNRLTDRLAKHVSAHQICWVGNRTVTIFTTTKKMELRVTRYTIHRHAEESISKMLYTRPKKALEGGGFIWK